MCLIQPRSDANAADATGRKALLAENSSVAVILLVKIAGTLGKDTQPQCIMTIFGFLLSY